MTECDMMGQCTNQCDQILVIKTETKLPIELRNSRALDFSQFAQQELPGIFDLIVLMEVLNVLLELVLTVLLRQFLNLSLVSSYLLLESCYISSEALLSLCRHSDCVGLSAA